MILKYINNSIILLNMKLINALGAVPYLLPSYTWNILTIIMAYVAKGFGDKYIYRQIYGDGRLQLVMIYEEREKYEADVGEPSD